MASRGRSRALGKPFDNEISLEAGITPGVLARAIQKLGFEPGQALQQAWRYGDGSRSWARVFAAPDQLTAYEFLSVKKILEQQARMKCRAPQYHGYEELSARDPRIRGGWYNPGWLPFGSLDGATMLLIEDHTPLTEGEIASRSLCTICLIQRLPVSSIALR